MMIFKLNKDEEMKNIYSILITALFVINLTACGSSPKKVVSAKTSPKISIEKFSLKLKQKVTPDIVYHTEKEMGKIVKSNVYKKLEQSGLLIKNSKVNKVDVEVTYHRRFVGEATSLASDSLAYPNVDFNITLRDGKKILKKYSREGLTVSGGFIMNLQLMAGGLREKSDEEYFIEVVGNTIVKIIEDI